MSWFLAVFAVSLLASSNAVSVRRRRAADAEKDLKPAETRVPILPYGGYEPYEQGLAYGVEPYGAGIHGVGIHGAGLHGAGAYGPGVVGVGAYGPGYGGIHGLVHKPIGLAEGIGYDSGYLKSGISDGALALGRLKTSLIRIRFKKQLEEKQKNETILK